MLLEWWNWLTTSYPDWLKRGCFHGDINLQWLGPKNYNYSGTLAFERGEYPNNFVSTGEIIVPDVMSVPKDTMRMLTDGGSIPRIAWSIPDLDPWTYMPAYLIHDWEFTRHHKDQTFTKSLEDVNRTLCEAVYTLMLDGVTKLDQNVIKLIYAGVSSPLGLEVWNGERSV